MTVSDTKKDSHDLGRTPTVCTPSGRTVNPQFPLDLVVQEGTPPKCHQVPSTLSGSRPGTEKPGVGGERSGTVRDVGTGEVGRNPDGTRRPPPRPLR